MKKAILLALLSFMFVAPAASRAAYDALSIEARTEHARLAARMEAGIATEIEKTRLGEIHMALFDALPEWSGTSRINQDGSMTFDLKDGSQKSFATSYTSKEAVYADKTVTTAPSAQSGSGSASSGSGSTAPAAPALEPMLFEYYKLDISKGTTGLTAAQEARYAELKASIAKAVPGLKGMFSDNDRNARSITLYLTDGSIRMYGINYSSGTAEYYRVGGAVPPTDATGSTQAEAGTSNQTLGSSNSNQAVTLGSGDSVAQATPPVQTTRSSAVADSDAGLGSADPESSDFQLVPCDGAQDYLKGADGQILRDAQGNARLDPESVPCDFRMVLVTFNRILAFLLYLSVPLIVGIIFYTGFKYLTAGGDQYKLAEAKKMLIPVAIGLFWVLAAWIVVKTFLTYFLEPVVGETPKEDVIFLNIPTK